MVTVATEKKGRRQRPPPIDRRRSLAGVPVLNPNAEIRETTGGDTVVLTVTHRRPDRGWFARFLPAVFERKHRLDELGTFVVRQIDGERTTLAIIEAFVERFHVTRREAELSTVQFLKSLAERQTISIAIK